LALPASRIELTQIGGLPGGQAKAGIVLAARLRPRFAHDAKEQIGGL